MRHPAASRFFRFLLPLSFGVLVGCATAHESDLGANRGYNDLNPGMPAYKPSLASPSAAPRASTVNSAKRQQYTPMVERTATGVRVVKDFSTQARSKSARANAAQTRAARSQQNSRMAKAYNDENLLTR